MGILREYRLGGAFGGEISHSRRRRASDEKKCLFPLERPGGVETEIECKCGRNLQIIVGAHDIHLAAGVFWVHFQINRETRPSAIQRILLIDNNFAPAATIRGNAPRFQPALTLLAGNGIHRVLHALRVIRPDCLIDESAARKAGFGRRPNRGRAAERCRRSGR